MTILNEGAVQDSNHADSGPLFPNDVTSKMPPTGAAKEEAENKKKLESYENAKKEATELASQLQQQQNENEQARLRFNGERDRWQQSWRSMLRAVNNMPNGQHGRWCRIRNKNNSFALDCGADSGRRVHSYRRDDNNNNQKFKLLRTDSSAPEFQSSWTISNLDCGYLQVSDRNDDIRCAKDRKSGDEGLNQEWWIQVEGDGDSLYRFQNRRWDTVIDLAVTDADKGSQRIYAQQRYNNGNQTWRIEWKDY